MIMIASSEMVVDRTWHITQTLSLHLNLNKLTTPLLAMLLLISNMNEIKLMSKQELSTCSTESFVAVVNVITLYNHDCTTWYKELCCHGECYKAIITIIVPKEVNV